MARDGIIKEAMGTMKCHVRDRIRDVPFNFNTFLNVNYRKNSRIGEIIKNISLLLIGRTKKQISHNGSMKSRFRILNGRN